MKRTIIVFLVIAVAVCGVAFVLFARSPHSAVDVLRSAGSFHVYLPQSLPSGYQISVNQEAVRLEDGVTYGIEATSGFPLVAVDEAPIGGQEVQRHFTPDQMLQSGWATSTEINGTTAWLGILTKGYQPGHQLTVLDFSEGNVAIQLSSSDSIDPQMLVQIARTMD